MKVGLDRFVENPKLSERWGRCALVSNQASVSKDFVPAWKVCQTHLGARFTAIFGPQHGFESTVQENMIETGHGRHLPTGLPVYSLYSETREPTAEMLSQVDTMIVDLQVTGCRIYTYKYTLAACLRAAKKLGKKVVVLDRHNPLGGIMVEGNVLETNTRSFVGEYPIPMRHGLTMGECARFFNHEIGAELEIVGLEGWKPERFWEQYDRQWVLTSPNIPILDSCVVFPGMVLLEGTSISEGRGTTLPFQFVGAPFIKSSEAYVERVKKIFPGLKGAHLRPTCFQPAFHKSQGEVCNGMQVHVLQAEKIASVSLGLAALRAFIEMADGKTLWRDPPYEYEYKLLPIAILIGARDLPEKLMAPKFDLGDQAWSRGSDSYISEIKKFLLYDRRMQVFTA